MKNKNYNLKFILRTIFFFSLFCIVTISLGYAFIYIMYLIFPNIVFGPFRIMIVCIISSSFIGCLLSCHLSKHLTKKITEVDAVLNRAIDGDFKGQVELPNRKMDIFDLLNNFNKLLKELDSNQILKEEFISNFSHEFKTPIVSILGYAELIIEDSSITEEERNKYLKIIVEESKRLVNLSTQTLELSKLDHNIIITDKEEFNIKNQIEESVLLLDKQLKEKNIEVKLKFNDVMFYSNKNMIKEVWINIISNAIKYSNDQGIIDIFSYEDNDKIVISIRDNGVGMDEEEMSHIFDRFYQVDKSHNQKGLGLGLSISKKIVELNGGTIEVSSVKGKGTLFSVIFRKKLAAM